MGATVELAPGLFLADLMENGVTVELIICPIFTPVIITIYVWQSVTVDLVTVLKFPERHLC